MILLPPFVCEISVNCTDCCMQLSVGYEKLASGEANRLTVCSIKPEQPSDVVTVRVTEYALAVPVNVCVTFGLAGNNIVTGGVPSPKFHTHCIIGARLPETMVD